ncbi:hypothetical protein M378DRAFT_155761 [Amanita muscaria Koide BX008]|uniref:Uncharacterized protein n=1 Tax=Amanita muscaria (strain Koide BX008) TaxID=946122 RepID=A0A0C2XMN1_AMAMK|nr:hypothetical protein M378DRAFT_155761 [Amanita muscaria Koide BX008]
MLSVLPQSAPLSLVELQSNVRFNALGSLDKAIDSFTKVLSRSGKTAVRLHCTIPMWSPSCDASLDLHDINELRSRLLLFVHDLMQSLRAADVSIITSYSLVPSNAPVCLVWALPPDLSGSQLQDSTKELLKRVQITGRDNVLLADSKNIPCLIIT